MRASRLWTRHSFEGRAGSRTCAASARLFCVIQHASQFEADAGVGRCKRKRLSQHRQAFGGAALPEQERAVRQIRPPRSVGEIHGLAEGLFRRIELARGHPGPARDSHRRGSVPHPARRACSNAVDGALEAVGDVEGAAGEVPGIEITRVEALRGLEEALCGIPLLARGADAACQYVALRVAGVESDGAVGFVEARPEAGRGSAARRPGTREHRHGRDSAPDTRDTGSRLRRRAASDRRRWPRPVIVPAAPAPSPARERRIKRRACRCRAISGADYVAFQFGAAGGTTAVRDNPFYASKATIIPRQPIRSAVSVCRNAAGKVSPRNVRPKPA